MKTLKRISALLLALLLAASFSINAFADGDDAVVPDPDPIPDSDPAGTVGSTGSIRGSGTDTAIPDPVPAGTTVEENPAGNTIYTNNGTVTTNNGTIANNYGEVETNNGEIRIYTYATPTEGNFGIVVNNNGNIENFDGGTVINNSGFVGNNEYTTTSRVVNNSGVVYTNSASQVENNFNDGIDYNGEVWAWATSDVTDQVEHQFHNYADITTDGCEGTYDTDAVKEYDGKYWVETDKNTGKPIDGSVTVTPEKGFTFDAPDIDKPDYVSVSGSGKGWTFSFTNLIENISIKLKGIKDTEPEPDPEPPKPDPGPTPAPYSPFSCMLVFELDGGVMPDGETELEMKCSAGQWIRLPEAPTKTGYEFAGWQTEVRGKTAVYEAGVRYKVSIGKTFTALWVEDQA